MFTPTDEIIVWRHIREERISLFNYLSTLADDSWDHPSLCDDWLVRDVLAHLILEYHYSVSNSYMDFITSGLRINRFMKLTAIKLGQSTPSILLEQFRDLIDEQQKPSSVSVINVLVDLLIHEQDIRTPLGQPSNMPLDALRLIFSHWEPTQFNFGEKITGVSSRVKGLEFMASDIKIHKGSGFIVEGRAQDILLTIAGRSTALDKLRGRGVELLAQRLNK